MKRAWVRAERDSEVRQAARAWKKAGVIDDAGLAKVEELFPVPWPDPTIVWRVLAFVFVSFAVIGSFVALALASQGHVIAGVAFVLAAVLAVIGEGLRPSASGPTSASGAAAGFWSVTCLIIGTADLGHWGDRSVMPLLIVGTAAWAAAAWRWGYPAFAVLSSVFFFLLLARAEQGRALWLVAGAALAAACVPLLDRRALSPSHRRSAACVLAVSLIAVYAAVNPFSLDWRLVEAISSPHALAQGQPSFLRAPAAVGAAVLPLFLLVWGIRSRRTLLIDLGIVFAASSLATLRYYVHLAPLWTVLTAAGAALIGLALWLHRSFDRAPGRERRGFTADALFEDEDRQQALGVAAAAFTLTPEARSAPRPEPGAFQGGGGASGGGGSSQGF